MVDLEYPLELHDLHNDYPCAAESIIIKEKELSTYNKNNLIQNELKHAPTPKLIPNLKNKCKYIVHYKNLQCYINKGLKVTKIHKVMSFNQFAWMKPYIEFNSLQRSKATNDFEKDFYKTMEDVRNRMEGRIAYNMKDKNKLVSNPKLK
jgi:hypothetical protein